jgi:hypothetical protein
LEERFYAQLSDPDKGRQLVSAIRSDKPRYIRDQLLILLDTASTYPATVMLQALHYCCQHAITGASDVKDVAAHYHGQSLEVVEEQLMAGLRLNPLNRQIPDEALIQPATSSIQDYNLF